MNICRCLRHAIALGLCLAVASVASEYDRDLTKPKGADPLFQIRRGAKWGFIDLRGNSIIPPLFDEEGFFFHGLARVRVGGWWGFINASGRFVIAPKFSAAGDFAGLFAPVRAGRKWGYINREGRMVVPPAFQAAASFREGMARVEVWNQIRCGRDRVFTKDNAPEYVFQMQSEVIRAFYPCFPLDMKDGYIDGDGRLAIVPRFAEARDFSEGFAAVRTGLDETTKYGFIDRNGSLAIAFRFDEAGDFSEGLAAVLVGRRKIRGIQEPGSYGYIDSSGKFVIEAQFAEAGPFSEGLAVVSRHHQNAKIYIDRTGKLAISARYIEAQPFSEYLANVCHEVYSSSWRCEYIDKQGRVVIDAVQAIRRFSDGLAIAQRGQTKAATIYIDRLGRTIAPTEMESERLKAPSPKPAPHH